MTRILEHLREVRLDSGLIDVSDLTLHTWAICGSDRIGYELTGPDGAQLFRGEDFRPGAATAADSDECLRGILGFLTLRPGDTDTEYFADYTAAQLAFAQSYLCETLQWLYGDDGPGTFKEVDV